MESQKSLGVNWRVACCMGMLLCCSMGIVYCRLGMGICVNGQKGGGVVVCGLAGEGCI